MSDGPADFRSGRDTLTIPTIWVAFALSLLLHLALLWQWLPKLHLLSPDASKLGEASGALMVRLMPAPGPPPSPKPSAPAPAPAPHLPAAPAHPRPVSPVVAFERPAPTLPELKAPAPARAPVAGDLSSYIEARRRARGQAAAPAESAARAQPAEDDKARSARIVAANLGTQRAQTFGYDPTHGGGVFQILHVGYDAAEFAFYGWNKENRHNTMQEIEVRKGNNSDIRLAIVRKMISIIREYERDDFRWDSYRLGRTLMLSARAEDNAGLEDFLMQEFFSDARLPR